MSERFLLVYAVALLARFGGLVGGRYQPALDAPLPEQHLGPVGDHEEGEEEVGARQPLVDVARDVARLADLLIESPAGFIPLSSVATVTREAGPVSINHAGQLEAVTLSFNLAPGAALGQVQRDPFRQRPIVDEIERVDGQLRDSRRRINTAVVASATTLTDICGEGTSCTYQVRAKNLKGTVQAAGSATAPPQWS